jgi:iron(III) transport system substrate-binding protein
MLSGHRRRTAAVAALTLVAAGCARANESPSPDATADSGQVTIACGATEEWCQAMTATFTKSTGLKAKFVRLSNGEAVAKLQASRGDQEFDVWHGGPADGFEAAKDAGLLEKYESPNAATIPPAFKDPDGYWTGVYVGALGFCSNTKVLGELAVPVPKSWSDLLDPRLKGNIAIAHPSTSGTAYTALWTQVALRGSEDAALAYMKQLHPNIQQYTKSGIAPGQMAGRGEVAVGVIFSHDCIALEQQGMKDLAVSFPSEGTGFETGAVALIKGAKHPVTAKKYIDWALTNESQELGPTAKAYQRPTLPSAKVYELAFDLTTVRLIDYDVAASGRARAELTTRFDSEVAVAPRA